MKGDPYMRTSREIDILKALGDQTRLRILALLSTGERCVCELMAALELPQSTVSRHVSRLSTSELIDGEKRGKWSYYRLASEDSWQYQELHRFVEKLAHRQPYLDDQISANRVSKQPSCNETGTPEPATTEKEN